MGELPRTTTVEAFDKQLRECLELLGVKGMEYQTGTKSIDSSYFREAAEELGISPYQVVGVLMRKHWQSILKFIASGGTKKGSEPIQGRIADMINYLLFLRLLVEEAGEDQIVVEGPMGNMVPATVMPIDGEEIIVRKDLVKMATKPIADASVEQSRSWTLQQRPEVDISSPEIVEFHMRTRDTRDPNKIIVCSNPLQSVVPPKPTTPSEYEARIEAIVSDEDVPF